MKVQSTTMVLAVALFCGAAGAAPDDQFRSQITTRDGRVYNDTSKIRLYPDGIVVTYHDAYGPNWRFLIGGVPPGERAPPQSGRAIDGLSAAVSPPKVPVDVACHCHIATDRDRHYFLRQCWLRFSQT